MASDRQLSSHSLPDIGGEGHKESGEKYCGGGLKGKLLLRGGVPIVVGANDKEGRKGAESRDRNAKGQDAPEALIFLVGGFTGFRSRTSLLCGWADGNQVPAFGTGDGVTRHVVGNADGVTATWALNSRHKSPPMEAGFPQEGNYTSAYRPLARC